MSSSADFETLSSSEASSTASVHSADAYTGAYDVYGTTTTLGKTFLVPYFVSSTQTFFYDHLTVVTPSATTLTTSSSGAVYLYLVSQPISTSSSSYEVVYYQDNSTWGIQAVEDMTQSSTAQSSTLSALSTSRISSELSVSPTSSRGSAVTSTTESNVQPSQSNAGAIAGGVVGGLAGLAFVAGAVVFYLRRQKNLARKGTAQEVSQIG